MSITVQENGASLNDEADVDAAFADMKRREGEWEDNGCRPLSGHEPLEDEWSRSR